VVIREQQMGALRKSVIDGFAGRVARELRSQFPYKLKTNSHDQVKRLVHEAIRRGKPYGVVSEADIKRYAEYMVEYQPDFDSTPWARPILAGAKSGSEKMDELDNYTTFELRR